MARIWVDLDNAPHVPFFAPIIRDLDRRGHRVWVTVREYGYTRQLLIDHGIPHASIGRHPGKSPVLKVAGLGARVAGLAQWAAGRRIDVAVSHGSRGLVLASRLLGIPSLTLYDYEFVSTGLFNRLSSRVLLPDALPDGVLRSIGLDPDRTGRYPGLKEEVYLGSFEPGSASRGALGLPEGKVIAVLRPPATSAHYHNAASEAIFQAVLDSIGSSPDAFGVVLPRTPEQASQVTKSLRNPFNFRILHQPVNGLSLIWLSDLVISGGGTMNREAAVLGVPVYSIFTGSLGTIDCSLEKEGRLVLVRSAVDVTRIKLRKRDRTDISSMCAAWKHKSAVLVDRIRKEILATARGAKRP